MPPTSLLLRIDRCMVRRKRIDGAIEYDMEIIVSAATEHHAEARRL
jgi:hypothetical protein